MNKDLDEFGKSLTFLNYLRQLETKNNDWPLGVRYRDEFEILEKLLRRSYYGK